MQERNSHVIREFDAFQDGIRSTLCSGVPVPGRADGLCGACAALLAKEQHGNLLSARAARAAQRNDRYTSADGSALPVGPHDAPAFQTPIDACGTMEKHRRLASAYAALHVEEGSVQQLQTELRAADKKITELEAAAAKDPPGQAALQAALKQANDEGERDITPRALQTL